MVPFGWLDGPLANRLIGAEWLTRRRYPEVPQADLGDRVRDFYRLFYHRDVTDAELETLLGG